MVLLAFFYMAWLLPTLKWYLGNQIIVTVTSTGIVGAVTAAYVFLLMPLIKKAFAEQTVIMYVTSSTMPKVQSTEQPDTVAIAVAVCVFAAITSLLTRVS